MFIHVCTYILTCIYVYTLVCIYIYIYIYIVSTYIHIYIYIYIYHTCIFRDGRAPPGSAYIPRRPSSSCLCLYTYIYIHIPRWRSSSWLCIHTLIYLFRGDGAHQALRIYIYIYIYSYIYIPRGRSSSRHQDTCIVCAGSKNEKGLFGG